MSTMLSRRFRSRPVSRPLAVFRRPLAIESLDERCLLAADPVGLSQSFHTLAVEPGRMAAQTAAPAPEVALQQAAQVQSAMAITVDGPTVTVPTQTIELTFNVSGSSGTLAYAVDWDDDGIHEIYLFGSTSVTLPYYGYSTLGPHPVHAFVFDMNTGQTAEITHVVNVEPWHLSPNAWNPSLTDLVYSTSDAEDFILVLPGKAFEPTASDDVVVILNLTDPSGPDVFFGVTGAVHVYSLGGDDNIFADASLWGLPEISQPVILHGGAGDDFLAGTSHGDQIHGDDGNDIILGGLLANDAGDYLLGGAGNDIIFGGNGADHVFGGNGSADLLHTGMVNTSLSNWADMLLQVRNEFSKLGPTGVLEGGSFILGTTVLDDVFADTVEGGSQGGDWILRDWNEDIIVDATGTDTITDI